MTYRRKRKINNIKVIIQKDIGLEIIKECGKKCFSTYWLIRSHKNIKYDSCFPSLSVLAKEGDCSTRTIQRDIAMLVEKGYLFVMSGDSGRNSTYYFIREPDIYTEEDLKRINKLMKANITE